MYEVSNVSTLKVNENHMDAENSLGFKVLFKCDLVECGTEDQVEALGGLLAITETVYNDYNRPYYWLGELKAEKGRLD